jgi:hypothetical protein
MVPQPDGNGASRGLFVKRLLDRRATPAVLVSSHYIFAEDDSAVIVFSAAGDTVGRIPTAAFTDAIAIAADGEHVAIEVAPGDLRVLALPALAEVARAAGLDGRIDRLDLTAGAEILAAVVGERLVMWRRAGSRLEPVALEQPAEAATVRFSRDGRFLLSAPWQSTELSIRDARSGRVVSRLPHADEIAAVRFSDSGDFVATLSGGRVRVWESATGALVVELPSASTITDVRFMSDDRYVVTAEWNGDAVVRLWRGQDLRAAACARSAVSLTPEQWRTWLGDLKYEPACAR